MRQITVSQMPMPVTGVYFMFRKGQLQYVGQSVNVAARVGQHIRSNPRLRDCDELRVFECAESELNDWEGLFIRLLRPPENGRVVNDTMHAPSSELADKQLLEMTIPTKGQEQPKREDTNGLQPEPDQRLLTRDQVQERYGITRQWLELAAQNGRGPAMIKISRRKVFYKPADIQAWLRRAVEA